MEQHRVKMVDQIHTCTCLSSAIGILLVWLLLLRVIVVYYLSLWGLFFSSYLRSSFRWTQYSFSAPPGAISDVSAVWHAQSGIVYTVIAAEFGTFHKTLHRRERCYCYPWRVSIMNGDMCVHDVLRWKDVLFLIRHIVDITHAACMYMSVNTMHACDRSWLMIVILISLLSHLSLQPKGLFQFQSGSSGATKVEVCSAYNHPPLYTHYTYNECFVCIYISIVDRYEHAHAIIHTTFFLTVVLACCIVLCHVAICRFIMSALRVRCSCMTTALSSPPLWVCRRTEVRCWLQREAKASCICTPRRRR